jgi:hypothetical protein
MANHDREGQRGLGHGQAQASTQIDQGNDRSPEIGHSGQQARHAGHDGDRFHLKHFTDVAEIDGEQLAPQREDTHTQRAFDRRGRETSMGWRVREPE